MPLLFEQLKSMFIRPVKHNAEAIKTGKAPRKTKKIKRSRGKELQTIEQLKHFVNRNGYCSLKVKSLFQLFGYQQRGSVNVGKILERLEKEGLFVSKRKVLDTDWNK